MSSQAPSLVVAFVLDASGSMCYQTRQTVEGVNEYVKTLKKDHEGKKVLYTLTKFNTQSQVLHAAVPVTDVPEFTNEVYAPGGGTALYDAVGETIEELEKRLDGETPALVVVLTDGQENSSSNFNLVDIKKMIEAKKEAGWSFIFMGAGEDAWMTGEALGVHKSLKFDADSMASTMRCMSAGTKGYSEAYTSGMSGIDSAQAFSEAYADSDARQVNMNSLLDSSKDVVANKD